MKLEIYTNFHLISLVLNQRTTLVMRLKKSMKTSRKEVSMTTNQIAFNRYLEEVRHNKELEGIEARKASSGEVSAQASQYQAETGRMSHFETQRHNLADEVVKQGQLQVQTAAQAENERHNQVSESIERLKSDRSYELGKYSNESERLRAQAAQISAGASVLGAQASQVSAASQAKQADVAASRQAEDARHNAVLESISRTQARAATTSAIGARLRGEASLRQATVAQEMLPYNKASAVAQVVSSGVRSVKDLTGVAATILALGG